MSSATLLDIKINYDNCSNLKSNTEQPANINSILEGQKLVHSVNDLKCFPQVVIKQEPIHLTEEDFRESLRNTWLPDIDANAVNLTATDVKKEYTTFLDSTFHDMDKIQCNNNGNTTTNNSTDSLSCTACHKRFFDSSSLREHQKSCVNGPTKNFLCGTCNKVFSTKSRLTNHTRIHTGVKPFACSVCSKAFADRSAYIKHEKIHFRQKEEKVECNLCGGLFSDSWGLKKHQLTHSGERPYECPICHKTFRTSSTLVVHKRIHTGEKPYPCTLCEKRFTVKTHLVTHNRTHSGERPYECTVCGRAFSDRSSWRRHSRRHDANSDTTSKTKAQSNANNRRLSAIESLQNFVTEQYMKPPQQKTENSNMPSVPERNEEHQTTNPNPNAIQFPTPKPFFENFHRLILEQQAFDQRLLPAKNDNRLNIPDDQLNGSTDLKNKEKSLVSPFFKNFQQTLMEQQKFPITETNKNVHDDPKINTASEESNKNVENMKKSSENHDLSNNTYSSHFYRSNSPANPALPHAPGITKSTESHTFNEIGHYNSRIHLNKPVNVPTIPTTVHDTQKTSIDLVSTSGSNLPSTIIKNNPHAYSYSYFLEADMESNKYDSNFNQFPINQFHSLTNMISIPMTPHNPINQKNPLKLFSKSNDTGPEQTTNPITNPVFPTVYNSQPVPMNFMDNQVNGSGVDKNLFFRRS